MKIPQLIIRIIIIAACIAVLLVILPYFGIAVPAIVIKIGCILLFATIAVLAVKYLMTLG